MMRWSSTKTYTEEDILRMQQEAVSRVHEFHVRAKTLPFYDVPENEILPYHEPVAVLEAPDEMESSRYEALPSEELHAAQEEPLSNFTSQYAPVQAAATATDPFSGLLSKFNLDGETLLIIGLLFLLYHEKADNSLLLALGYLLL